MTIYVLDGGYGPGPAAMAGAFPPAVIVLLTGLLVWAVTSALVGTGKPVPPPGGPSWAAPTEPMIDPREVRRVRTEMLLYAAGRTGATDDIGLESLGLTTDGRGRISVDPRTFQTAVPHIYAAGDVIGPPSLASTSMEQGRIAACHAFCEPAHPPPQFFPYGIYAVPEISTIGMTEAEVREKQIPYECGVARFRETSRGHIMGVESGFLKMLFALETRRLLGVHIMGEGATEIIHIGQAVLNLEGTLDYFVENTFNFPTLAEAYKVAALDAWNRMPKAQPSAVSLVEVKARAERAFGG